MSARWTSWLAVSLWAVSMMLAVCVLVLMFANRSFDELLGEFAFIIVVMASLGTVGALLAVHRPGNPIGWILLAGGFSYGIVMAAIQYAEYIAETAPGGLPELTLLFWLGAWTSVVAIFLPATIGILLFPTGRLPSRHWRPFAWLVAIYLAVWTVAEMLSPGPLDPLEDFPQFTNPIGVESMGRTFNVIVETSAPVVFILFVGAVASLFSRLRSGTAVERQQIKWFAYASIFPLAGFGVFLALHGLSNVHAQTANLIGEITVTLGVAVLPVTICIAILRHNLYDIDRLINRTLVYGSLTLLLVVGFASSVILFQFILSPLTGGNDLAIAGSTLLVAALFRPIRDRLQLFVDRRFYRQKYDAARTLEQFSARLRDEVDLRMLTDELRGAVRNTMQPAHVSLWLRTAVPEEDRR